MAKAKDIARQVEFTMTQRVRERFPKARIQQAARVAAAIALQEVKDRTNQGLDVDGRPFRAYSSRYAHYKARFIAGLQPRRKRGSKTRLPNRTPYAARRVEDRMRLTGRLFSDMTVRQVRGRNDEGFLGGDFVLDFKTDRSRKIAFYNIAKGFNFWGLSKPSTPRGRLLIAKMKSAFKGALGFSGGGNFSLNRGE